MVNRTDKAFAAAVEEAFGEIIAGRGTLDVAERSAGKVRGADRG
jgi:hypothetical protein